MVYIQFQSSKATTSLLSLQRQEVSKFSPTLCINRPPISCIHRAISSSMRNSIPAAIEGKPIHLFLNLSFVALLLFYLYSPNPSIGILERSPSYSADESDEGCSALQKHKSYEAKCSYLTSEASCNPEGYINYLYLFYCICGRYPALGYAMLILWLILLFYLLGDTTARYFCSNLEGLSWLMKLPPALAGVTLLSLGNGAPDVFSTIVSFVGTSSGVVGLNGILGGVFFVSSVVAGTVSIYVSHLEVSIDKSSFLRDICFLIFSLSVLLVILIIGEISVLSAMAFTSLYAVYALIVWLTHLHHKESISVLPTLNCGDSRAPILDELVSRDGDVTNECSGHLTSAASIWFSRLLYFLELPLYLPRRLTIPDVCKDRWSRPFAVVSVVLAPILLATIWDSKMGSEVSLVIYLICGLAGIVMGIAAFVKTKNERPPTVFLFPWLAAGFLMSVVWTYIIAEELVSLLVSLGSIVGISPSILGLTVLAWGNSMGDLIANVAVARSTGGQGGTQVAMSGCFGGPIFNTLVGLGLSLVFSSWAGYPYPLAMPKDPTIFQTLGFLTGGLLWTLVILPRRGMVPDRLLGYGLLSIYLCFLSLRLSQCLGLLHLQ